MNEKPQNQAKWTELWSGDAALVTDTALRLFAPLPGEPANPAEASRIFAQEFSTRLKQDFPHLPGDERAIRRVLIMLVGTMLKRERTVPSSQFRHLRYLAILRPVRRLHAGELTEEICAGLYDYHRGVWEGRLSRYELYCVRVGLAQTLSDLPPDDLGFFWKTLREGDTMHRHAMLHGFSFLRSSHSVPHLLEGFRRSPEHTIRAAIVDCLEQIGVPEALPMLIELKRETAYTDWTLSRHIARAIRVIEMHNRNHIQQQLLRPTSPPPQDDRGLLRPALDNEIEQKELLRSYPPEGEILSTD